MAMFMHSGFSLPKLVENLFYALEEEDKKSKKYLGDDYVECILRMGRIKTRKIVIPRSYLKRYRIAIHPRVEIRDMSEVDLIDNVKVLDFGWDGRSKEGNLIILDLLP